LKVVEQLHDVAASQLGKGHLAQRRFDVRLEHALGKCPAPLIRLAVALHVFVQQITHRLRTILRFALFLALAVLVARQIDPLSRSRDDFSRALSRIRKLHGGIRAVGLALSLAALGPVSDRLGFAPLGRDAQLKARRVVIDVHRATGCRRREAFQKPI
jgi:hypothetical protein